MNAFVAIVFASLLSRLGYQMARSPVLPTFAADQRLGAGRIVPSSAAGPIGLDSGKRDRLLGGLEYASPK
jgi:hypothetical protein